MAEDNDIKIIVFACWKWGYGSADMAGTIRAQYPDSIRNVLVPCSGRVGPDLVLRAFGRGADGVVINAWYPGECDYETGNYHAYRQVEYLKEILKVIGISPDRLKMIYCTAAEGQKFQNEAIEIDKTIRKLGPSPLRTKSTPKKGKAKAKAEV
jgi:F420-non-reducing hydrogenase iron-sulfur subunit